MSNPQKLNLAILGATGNVGRKFIEILEERDFPFTSLKLLASEKSAGNKIKVKDKEYTVELATKDSFKDVDIVLASAGGSISKELVPHAVKSGAVVIDNSSAYRMDPDVPLVVAGVNNEALKKHKGIIANPNCTTAQLVVPLKVLNEIAGLKRIIVSSYQSVSGAGKAAMDELTEQTQKCLSKDLPWQVSYESKSTNRRFAFNVIPHIDVFSEDGYTKEEIKVTNESRKILGIPDLKITCTAVRVPVFISHSESVNVELQKSISKEEIIKAFKDFGVRNKGMLEVFDNPENSEYPMAIDVAEKDPVYVGRIRIDHSCPNTYNLWVVADNLRIGAALNTVRIAEIVVKESLLVLKRS